jgi:DNA-binding phage protein
MSTATIDIELSPEAAAAQLLNQIATGYMVSAALQVALKLEIADRLAAGPRPVSELAREAGVAEDGLYRVLRALASVGIFEEQPGPAGEASRAFALTLPARMMCKGPGSMYDMGLFITSPTHFRVYSELLHSVQTGQPAVQKVTGLPVFEYFAGQPEFSALFNNAMTAFSAAVIPAVLDAYDFSGIDVLVDVAGGHGQVLTSILRKYPAMHGVLFDLDHVIAGAGPLLQASGVADRVRTESGDFFTAVPKGDAYIMKHIIHDWDDAEALTILRNIRTQLDGQPNGRVILVESVIPADNSPNFGKLIDIEMMLMPGGRERTAAEFKTLFARAGFSQMRVVPTQAPLWVVEARV